MTRHTAHFDSSAEHSCLPGEGFGQRMDASSGKQGDREGMAPGVLNFLSNLPSRGLFSSTVLSSNPGGMRVYICEHDTSPPEGQQIKTNQQNILIRSLMINSKKGDSSSKDGKVAGDGPRKRAAEKGLDGRASAKRANSQATSKAEGSSSRLADKDFQSLTVERLRALLKEKGLSTKGKKDELITRLKTADN